MGAVDSNSGINGSLVLGNNFGRFIPEPKSRYDNLFGKVLNTIGSVASGAVGSITGIDPAYQALIEKQIEVQQQMQLVSFHSNIEKSKHETQMAAVRNLRVG